MTGAHAEAVLNTLSQANFVHLILNTEANLVSQIAKLSTDVKVLVAHSKKLETRDFCQECEYQVGRKSCGDRVSVLGKCPIIEDGYDGNGWNTNVY